VPYAIPAPGVLLPVGISFFTFQSMSYTIDFYRGHIERERSFIRYATYVSLFPQLVAGPIERSRNLLRQLRHYRQITREDVSDGLSLFIVGLFKKVALADYLAIYVDKVYDAPGSFKAPALLLATFAFAWQIYFDFSGYTDMAWFKDYVYFPLGGNRKGKLNTYKNMVLTMLISGIWHGAAWTFLIWGALHAIGRVLTRERERTAFYRERVPRLAKQLFVFTFVCFAWIFFRARNLGQAWLIITRIFTSGWADPMFPLLALGLVLVLWLYQFAYESRAERVLEVAPGKVALVVGMVFYMAAFVTSGGQPFIYFQF
jgi:D-alanyl-lipoteichoic acid acyltransferase DltB (MBOAT superfamily)